MFTMERASASRALMRGLKLAVYSILSLRSLRELIELILNSYLMDI